MSAFLATTTVRVERGEGVDSFGDPIDVPTVVSTGFPAAVTEVGQLRFRPADQRGGVVETHLIRLRPNVEVQEGDRLIDEREGVVYLAQDVTYPQSVFGMADTRVTAHRVGALSQPVNG